MEWSRDKLAGVTWRERECVGEKEGKSVEEMNELLAEHHSNRYLGERGRWRIDGMKVAKSSKGSSKRVLQAMGGRWEEERRSVTAMSDDGSITRLSFVS